MKSKLDIAFRQSFEDTTVGRLYRYGLRGVVSPEIRTILDDVVGTTRVKDGIKE